MRTGQRRAAWCSACGIVAVLAVAAAVLGARSTPIAARQVVEVSRPTPAVVTVPTPPAVLPDEGPVGTPIPVAIPTADPSTPTEPPIAFTVVPIYRAAVAVTLPGDVDEAQVRALIAAQEGVVHQAGVTVTSTSLGGVPADVAVVDPAEFRSFTPDATANHQPLWDRIAAGDVAVTHEFGATHDVVLGVLLELGAVGPQRVGAYATNGTPPVADAIVGAAVPLAPGTRRLLVALDAEASPSATVEALSDAGLMAEEIPDPRAPRDDIVIPAGGITPENVWDHLAVCESSGDWQINTGNGYYGGVQFLPESWRAVGGSGLPHEHPREEQIYRATLLWQIQGWEAWPQCARRLGLIVDPPPQPAAGTPSATPSAAPSATPPE